MAPADGEAVASTGNQQVQDPRLTEVLRWSAGVCGPIAVLLLGSMVGVMVSLRDTTRDLKNEVRGIAENDKKQTLQLERNSISEQNQNMEIFRLKDRVTEIQRRMGMR